MENGYFVDWDGKTRRVETPGNGYTCKVVARDGFQAVDVIDSQGFVCHDADYHESLDSLGRVGVIVSLVP